VAKISALRPLDVATALGLLDRPDASLTELSFAMGVSVSQIHDSIGRLERSQLALPKSRRISRPSLFEFIEHGVKYAFPGELGPRSLGIPTAYSSAELGDEIIVEEAVVWATARGSVVGDTLTPLYPKAIMLPERWSRLYDALALVDAIRIGRTRERTLAVQKLRAKWF
jgi:hypothetical protein